MHYILKQNLPENAASNPIEIHIAEDEFTVGRSTIAQLEKFNQMSRQHATFFKSPSGALFVKDNNSLNGVYVNTKKIGSGIHPLVIGDVIGLGVPNLDSSAGFVCTVCTGIKQEVIDLTDDDEEAESPVNPGASINVNTGISLENHEILSKSVTGVQPQSSCNLGDGQVAVSTNVSFPESSFVSRASLSNVSSFASSSLKSDNASSNKVVSSFKFEPFINLSHSIQQTSVPVHNNFVNAQTDRTTPTVHLVKCDSEQFEWPPDVQNPFKKKKQSSLHYEPPSPLSYKSKRYIKKLSSDTDSDVEITTRRSPVPINQNNILDLENIYCIKYETESVNNITGNVHKESTSEETDHVFLHSLPKKMRLSENDRNISVPSTSKSQFRMSEPEIEMTVKPSMQQDCDPESHEHSDFGEEVSYSQCEEVIYISDDEEYLDCKSSLTYVPIKEEVLSDVPEDLEDDACKELFDSDSEYLTPAPSESSVHQSRRLGDKIESIEAIANHITCMGGKSPNTTSDFSRGVNDIPLDNFPVHSEAFENMEKLALVSDEEEEISSLVKAADNKNDKSSSKESLPVMKNKSFENSSSLKAISKSSGRTLLTNAKPMPYRPRKLRGREEGFKEQTKYKMAESPDNKKQTKNSKKNAPVEQQRNLSLSTNVVLTGSTDSRLKKFKIPLKSKTDYQRKGSLDGEMSGLSRDTNAHNTKKPSVKTRPEKFGSRMGFLTHEYDSNPRKKRPTTNAKALAKQKESDRHMIEKPHTAPQIAKAGDTPLQNDRHVAKQDIAPQINNNILNNNVNMTESQNISSQINSYKTVSATENLNIASQVTNHVSNKTVTYPASVNNISSHRPENIRIESNTAKPTDPRQARPTDPRQNRVTQPSRHLGGETPCVPSVIPAAQRPNIAPLATTYKSVTPAAKDSRVLEKSRQENGVASNKVPERCEKKENMLHNVRNLGLVKFLLRMNPKWLEEQLGKTKPPEFVSKGAADIPLYFTSYQAYVNAFYPMIVLEIWETMFVESKAIFKSPRKAFNKFYFTVISYVSREDCIELSCEAVINDKAYQPREGVITVLDVKENSKKIVSTFGYIFKHRVFKLNNENSLKNPQSWKALSSEWWINAELWKFHVYIKKKDISIALGSLMKGNGICYIGNKLRLVDALGYVKHSTLVNDILKPTWKTFSVNYSASSQTRDYTDCQMQVIKNISAEIVRHSLEPKIILIQGPPGTGKTHTLVGLLERLVYDCKSPQKILVVTPSNAAIDEIGSRLIDLNDQLRSWKDYPIKFVRVGIEKQISKKMLPYFLDRKAKEHHRHISQSESNRKDSDLANLSEEICALERKKYRLSDQENAQLRYLKDQYRSLKDQYSNKRLDYISEFKYKANILKESHIVLSTLSSCGLSVLHKTFKPSSDVQFSCCIVDEATQCIELEILQPLMFGINKLVMIGDHEQLPATVISKLASQYGFERSMFERLHLYFQTFEKKTPVFTLTEQFRMHSVINEFPSKQFYDHKLITNPIVDVRYKPFSLNPFLLLDMINSQESSESSSKLNCGEAEVIIGICTFLVQIVDSPSIGILTPYQGQKSLYEGVLLKDHRFQNIEINTIDGFQGREKDVIIMSCVRANSQSGGIGFLSDRRRLNVAITRAKKCLIICAHTVSLMAYSDWRSLILHARDRKVCVSVSSPKDIPYIIDAHLKKKKK